LLPAHGNWTDPHNHYTFSGKEWDEYLDSYEFGYRQYDPAAGVWLTQDPLRGEPQRPRTLHRYQYVFASPISYRDAYGLQGGGGGGFGTVTPEPVPVPPTPTPLTPTPTPSAPTGAQCTPEPSWWSDPLWWSKTAQTLDTLALVLSGMEALTADVVGAAFVGGFAALGTIEGGIGAGPGALLGLKIAWGFDVAIAGSSILSTPENVLGVLSFGATGISDVLTGYTGPTESGFAIGQDTLVSARNGLAGLVPESNADFFISASQLRYDIERNSGDEEGSSIEFSGWGDAEAWGNLSRLIFQGHWW